MPANQISGISAALGLKSALEDTEQRFLNVGPHRNVGGGTKSPTTGVSDIKLTLPVLYEQGGIFAQNAIHKPGFAPTLTDVPNQGTIIEYQDDHGQSTFGLVTHQTKTYKEGIFVRAINQDYAQQLKTQKPSTKHITLTPKNTLHLFFDVDEFALSAADNRPGNLFGRIQHHDKLLDTLLMIFISSLILILCAIIYTFI